MLDTNLEAIWLENCDSFLVHCREFQRPLDFQFIGNDLYLWGFNVKSLPSNLVNSTVIKKVLEILEETEKTYPKYLKIIQTIKNKAQWKTTN